MASVLLKNATIINEGLRKTADLLIDGEIISEILWDCPSIKPQADMTIDCTGLFLLPGIIDDHVHFREPGLEFKADMHSESSAAVAGGVTSIMDMPNTLPKTTDFSLLQEKISIAQAKCLCNFSFYMGATPENIDLLISDEMKSTCGIKVFMGSSTGNMLLNDERLLNTLFKSASVPIAIHSEDENIVRANADHYKNIHGEKLHAEHHPLIRSREACIEATKKAVGIAEKYDCHLHILHLSTKEEVELLREKKDTITAEVCIHHLLFDDSHYSRLGNLIKVNPSIKTATDRQALMDGILSDIIDVIATDHAPHTREEKEKPYSEAPSGAPMIQHSLPVMLEMSKQGRITLEKLVEKMCHKPADIFHIHKRGYIRKGYFADITLVSLQEETIISGQNILYKCQWSPLQDKSINSKVIYTFVNGNLVYSNGIVNDTLTAKVLTFNR